MSHVRLISGPRVLVILWLLLFMASAVSPSSLLGVSFQPFWLHLSHASSRTLQKTRTLEQASYRLLVVPTPDLTPRRPPPQSIAARVLRETQDQELVTLRITDPLVGLQGLYFQLLIGIDKYQPPHGPKPES